MILRDNVQEKGPSRVGASNCDCKNGIGRVPSKWSSENHFLEKALTRLGKGLKKIAKRTTGLQRAGARGTRDALLRVHTHAAQRLIGRSFNSIP